MARLNKNRVVAGGLLAGGVMNVLDYVTNNFILASDWQRVAQARNIDMAVMAGTSGLVTYVVIDLLYGIVIVWTYAAIRPRYGPGASTALIASCAVFVSSGLVLATLAGAFFPWDVYIRTAALSLVSMLAGGLTGARLYQEEKVLEDSL